MGTLIKPRMALKCYYCDYRPPLQSEQQEFDLHVRLEHDGEKLHLDLVAVCPCGTVMCFVKSSITGGGFKDWFECPREGNTGFVRRKKT